IQTSLLFFWCSLFLDTQVFAVAVRFGTGVCFVAAFILLICAGLCFVWLGWFVSCAFLAGLSFLAGTACSSPADGRFYLPLLILLIAVAVLPLTWAAKNLVLGKRVNAAVAIFALFAAAGLGSPSRSGYYTVKTNRSQAWDALHFTTPARRSPQFIAQRHFTELFSRQPGIVLSDIVPVYLDAPLPEPFVAAPLDGKLHYL